MSLHHLVHHLYQPGCGPKEHIQQCHQFVTYKVVCVWNPCKHRFEEHIEKIVCVWNPCKHRFEEHIQTIKVILNPCKELIKRCFGVA